MKLIWPPLLAILLSIFLTGSAAAQSATQQVAVPSPTILAPIQVTTTTFTANWTPVVGADDYDLQVSTRADFGNIVWSGTTGNTNLSITYGTLQPNTLYYYQVTATLGANTSAPSSPATVTTDPFPAPLVNAATNITIADFTVNWIPVPEATSYSIDISLTPDFGNLVLNDGSLGIGTASSDAVAASTGEYYIALEPGQTYYYRIRANGPGYYSHSPYSATQSVTTPSYAGPQSNAATNITTGSFTANWNAVPGATGYSIDISLTPDFGNLVISGYHVNGGNTTSVDTSTFPSNVWWTPIQNGQTYYYRVRANNNNVFYNLGGIYSAPSATQSATTLVFPAPSVNAVTNVAYDTVTLNWSPDAGATYYEMQYSTTSDFSANVSSTVYLGNGTSANIVNPSYPSYPPINYLQPSTTYYYRIFAVNSAGENSQNSPTQSFTTTPFPGPQLLPASNITVDTFTLNWVAAPSATGYYLDISTTPDFGNLVVSNQFVNGGGTTSVYANESYYNSTAGAYVSNILPGTTYYYRMRTADGNDLSSNSTFQSVTTNAVQLNNATNISYNSFTANWNAPGAVGLFMDVSSTADFGNLVVGNLYIGNGTTTSASVFGSSSLYDNGLQPATTYYYRIRAWGPNNVAMPYSATQSLTTLAFPAPQNVGWTNFDDADLTISWSPVSLASRYGVEISHSSFNNFNYENAITINGTNITWNNLIPGTTYYYAVVAIGPNNVVSPLSAVQSITTGTAPTPVLNTPTNTTPISFLASWSAVPGATGYALDVSSTPDFGNLVINNEQLSNSNSTLVSTPGGYQGYGGWQFGVIQPGTTYYYRIRAIFSSTPMANSALQTVTTSTFPPPTVNGATNITNSGFTANWNTVTSATGYSIDVSTTADFGNLVVSNVSLGGGNATSANVSTPGLPPNSFQPGVTYYYRIRTNDANVSSANSVVNTVTTVASPVPQLGSATNITPDSFTANWSPVSEAFAYYIDVSSTPDFGNLVITNLQVGISANANLSTPGSPPNILLPSTTYYYRIRAGSSSFYTLYSPTQSVTTSAFPAPQVNVATNITFEGFTANWNSVAGATGYTVDVSTTPDFGNLVISNWGINGGGTTSAAISSLSYNPHTNQTSTAILPGGTYYYRLRATGPNFSSAYSITQTFTATTVPAPTVNAATSPGFSNFTLNWQPVNGAISYAIDISSTADFGNLVFSQLYLGNGTITSVDSGSLTYLTTTDGNVFFTHTVNLQSGTTYYYRIYVNGPSGTISPASAPQTVTTLAFPAPQVAAASNITIDGFTANWAVVTGATGYAIDVSSTSDFGNLVISNQTINSGTTTSIALNTTTSPPIFSGWGGGIVVDAEKSSLSSGSSLVITSGGFNGGYPIPTPVYFQPNTTYYYRIRATGPDSAISPNSTIKSVTTAVLAAPQVTAATNITVDGFTANWNTVPLAVNYSLDVSTTADFGNLVLSDWTSTDGNTTSANISPPLFDSYYSPIQPGNTYYYRLRTNGPNNTTSPYTATQTFSSPIFPAPVVNAATNIGVSGFTLNWQAVSGAIGYYIDISTTADFGNIVVPSWYVDGGNTITTDANVNTYGYWSSIPLDPSNTYYYRISAVGSNTSYTSHPSSTQNITTLAYNPPPGVGSLNPTTSSFTVQWSAVTGATSYLLTVATAADFSQQVFDSNVGNITSYTLTNLEPSTTYYYKVDAYGSPGYTGYSTPQIANTTLPTNVAGYATWAQNLGLVDTGARWDVTPFGDNLPNLARFAMNLGAHPAGNQLPVETIANISGVECLTLQYRQLKSLSGVQLIAQYSYDLVNWVNLPAQNIVQLADIDAYTASYQASVPLPNTGSVFLRINAVSAP